MAKIEYDDEQIAAFLEVAVELGIGRTMRKLGYPVAWGTAQRWMKNAGIEAPIDEIKARAKEHHDWYQTEDILIVAQEGISRVHEALQSDELLPDEAKKLSEAFQKFSNQWLLLQGKANNISETRKTDTMDLGIMDLINEEKARNATIEGAASIDTSIDA